MPNTKDKPDNAKAEWPNSLMPDESGCASSEPFVLRVLGDSMEPEFKDGCIIIVDPSGTAEHGSYVVAKLSNGLTFRQLIITDKSLLLKPLNPGYKTELLESKNVISGIVVQRGGTRRSEHKHYV